MVVVGVSVSELVLGALSALHEALVAVREATYLLNDVVVATGITAGDCDSTCAVVRQARQRVRQDGGRLDQGARYCLGVVGGLARVGIGIARGETSCGN